MFDDEAGLGRELAGGHVSRFCTVAGSKANQA